MKLVKRTAKLATSNLLPRGDAKRKRRGRLYALFALTAIAVMGCGKQPDESVKPRDDSNMPVATEVKPGDDSNMPETQPVVEQPTKAAPAPKPEPVRQVVDVEKEIDKLDIAKPGFKVGIVISDNGVNCRTIPDSERGDIVTKLPASKMVGLIGVTKASDGRVWDRIAVTSDTTCFAIASSINRLVPDEESGETQIPTMGEVIERNDKQALEPVEQPQVSTNTQENTVTSTSSGKCNYPDDLDSRGRRCGKRAASERPGGR